MISPYFAQQMCIAKKTVNFLQISNRHGKSYVGDLQRRERSLGEVCSVPGRCAGEDGGGDQQQGRGRRDRLDVGAPQEAQRDCEVFA